MARYVLEEDTPTTGRYVIEDAAPAPTQAEQVRQQDKNVFGGLIRGAGSIGSTLVYPYDRLKGGSAEEGLRLNRERRAAIDAGLQELIGSDPESAGYATGKIGSEIMGTMGAGGVLGNVAGRVAPGLPALSNALRTGGMRAGSTPGAANMATRVLGGGITGGTMAGMVDPEQAGTGALIGGALPPALMAAGKVGQGIGRVVSGPTVAEPVRKAVEGARSAGYVIPPTQAKPTLVNRALEGFSGKLTTAQNASAKNQPVTNKLVAKALGLADDTPVSLDALKNIRAEAGKAYEAVKTTGVINTTPSYTAALDDAMASAKQAAVDFPNDVPSPIIAKLEALKTGQMSASGAVAKIKELRNSADAAYRAGDKDLGKALKTGSAALEDAIETHLKATNAPADLLNGFRDARQLIAKTYSVEKAMNATTGNVDAVKLASQLAKGKPLSGGIKTAAEFGHQFPKAAQTIERMGSLPQTSPLDWIPAASLSAATSNPLLMAGALARPAARSAALSPMIQNGLSKIPAHQLQGLLSDPELLQLLYRSAPVAATSR